MTATMKPSEEATSRQLELARAAGNAYHDALSYMIGEVADTGAIKEADDYAVAFAQEKAEGLYLLQEDGELAWVEPGEENCHIEIAVCDRADGRFIPGLDVTLTLTSAGGERIGPFEMPFLWHPGLYHYGRDIRIPGEGEYTLTVAIAAPRFPRHDKVNGRRYARDVTVEFPDVYLTTGQG